MTTLRMGRWLATIALLAVCSAKASENEHCEGGALSRAQLLQIVKAHLKRNGVDVTDVVKHTKMDVDPIDCDYFVAVTDVPGRPGGFTVYRVSRAGKIVSIVPGE
jgi:hypothetical protein